MDKKMEMTATYMGRPITELTREELIEALIGAAVEIHRLMDEKEHQRNFIMENFVRHRYVEHA